MAPRGKPGSPWSGAGRAVLLGVRPAPGTAHLLPAALLAVLALGVGARPTAARAETGAADRRALKGTRADNAPVSLEDFTAALGPLGEWLVHPTWGTVWRPRGVDPGWQPYFRGRWTHTADGWYWVSDEPWAWATYHFGRWTLDPLVGWLWAPGKRWAPAWVVWREGAELVGWAPLGPSGREHPATYTFVPRGKISERVETVALSALRLGPALKNTRRLVLGRPPAARPLPGPGAVAQAGH